ncbi:MAG: acyl--CoA ligase, partial [Rhodobacteraceae bacterium]|nr:acyl--CoA ligase [Paracoccaceae bacterium]
KIREIHLAGSNLSDELALKLLTSFEHVVDLYASTESNRSFKNVKSLTVDGIVTTKGQPLDSIVQIIDPDGNTCGAGIEGVVRVKNNYLVKGYLNNPEAEKASFRNGWFYPGDRGKWGSDGQLVILGRTDDVINLGGVKINGTEVDAVLQSVDGIADAVCFKSPLPKEPDTLIAFVVIEKDVDPQTCIDRLRKTCLATLSTRQIPAKIIEVTGLPKAQKGGTKRWKCQNLYEQKETQEPV